MSFNASEHMIKMKGKDYLQVMWRLVWFREDHPDWGINAECIEQDQGHAIFKAVITDENGIQKSSGHGSETKNDFGDFLEKAETKAVGRALAMLGYGTQFAADEFDEGERIVDSPVSRKQDKPVETTPAKSMKDLMMTAKLAYGENAKARFDELLIQAGCTIHSMTEDIYDNIKAQILEDIRKNAQEGAA